MKKVFVLAASALLVATSAMAQGHTPDGWQDQILDAVNGQLIVKTRGYTYKILSIEGTKATLANGQTASGVARCAGAGTTKLTASFVGSGVAGQTYPVRVSCYAVFSPT